MLPSPSLAAAFTQWTWQPLAIALAVGAALWYVRASRRAGVWPIRRTVGYLLGLALLIWTTCGFFGAYSTSLYWTWASRVLIVWLVVPAVVLAGKPLHLAADGGALRRLLDSTPARVLGHPLVAPATVPVLSAVLFFGPVPAWAVQAPPFAWALDLVLCALGLLALAPLLGPGRRESGLAVAAALSIGMIELILDAIPGIVLRLHTHLVTGFWDHRDTHPWSPAPLHDQQLAGAIVWVVAEAIDLPFLVLAFRRWLRADANDAAEIDAVLDAERVARRALAPGPGIEADRDAPWWLNDPEMQRRLNRGG